MTLEARGYRALLTPEEFDILHLSATMTDPDICAATGWKQQTIKNKRHALYQKLGVSGPHALLHAVRRVGWLKVPE